MCVGEARTWLAAAVLAALASAPGGAHAQGEPPAFFEDWLASLVYEAPEGCPARSEFIARVKARTQAAPATRAHAPPRLRVTIRLLSDHAAGTIAIEDSDGALAGRRIRAATCDEAADALALIAALALDPQRRRESLEVDPATAAPSTADDPGSADSPPPAAGSTSGERAPAVGERAPAVGERARAAARQPARTPAQTAAAGPSDAPDELAAEGGAAAQRFVLTASGLFASAVVPDTVPGVALVAAYAVQPPALPELALRAGFAITPAVIEERAGAAARFAWWSALLGLCAGLRDAGEAASLWLCAAGEAGRLSAEGRRTLDPRTEDRWWLALGPALVVQWEPWPPLVLQAGAGAPFALVRDRFLVGETLVYQAPRLGIRVDLGLGVRIW